MAESETSGAMVAMKRFLIWTFLSLAVLAGLIVVAFQVSPLPSVFAIRYIFSKGDQAAMSALASHVPPGVSERLDLAYGDGPNEIFDIFYPDGTNQPLPTIVWVHGGAWIGGNKEGVANYLRILAGQGYTTVGIDYTVAPAAIYPTQTGQVLTALGYLTENATALNIDPTRIILAGDSAGSQLASQTAAIITSPDYAARVGLEPTIAPGNLIGTLLFCGAYRIDGIDLDGEFGWFLRTVLWAYTGVKDFMNDPAVETASVANYVTGNFPPTFISGGNGDPLTPQSMFMAQQLSNAGVPVDTLFFPDDHEPAQPHEYQFNLDSPEGRQALDGAIDFLGRVAPVPPIDQSP